MLDLHTNFLEVRPLLKRAGCLKEAELYQPTVRSTYTYYVLASRGCGGVLASWLGIPEIGVNLVNLGGGQKSAPKSIP
jgi:hypothetical protein